MLDDFIESHFAQLSLFHEDERCVQYGTASKLGLQERGLDPDVECAVIQYRSHVQAVIDRLDLQGFTLDTARKGFSKGLQARKRRYKEYIGRGHDLYRSRLDAVEDLTFEIWSGLFAQILSESRDPGVGLNVDDDLSHVVNYMASEKPFGFPGYDSRHFVRAALEFFVRDESVVLDLTEFAVRGMQPEDVTEHAEAVMSENYDATSRTIVITEGKSDTWIIERSLKLLLPHLTNYFRFMDFEGANLGGSAGKLASIAKAFSGAGIVNKTVALFDNDTAANEALRSVESAVLSDNILALQYPYFNKLERYPTIGPTGISRMNVNELAGSIELYLGEKCLRDENGDLAPVQWKGYSQSVGEYQGEVLDKRTIQQRFEDKLSACEKNPDLLSTYDWTGIRLILNELQYAFHQQNAERILNDDRRY